MTTVPQQHLMAPASGTSSDAWWRITAAVLLGLTALSQLWVLKRAGAPSDYRGLYLAELMLIYLFVVAVVVGCILAAIGQRLAALVLACVSAGPYVLALLIFIVHDHRWGASLFDYVLYEFFGYDRYDHWLIWPAVISGVPAVLMLIGAIVVLALGGQRRPAR